MENVAAAAQLDGSGGRNRAMCGVECGVECGGGNPDEGEEEDVGPIRSCGGGGGREEGTGLGARSE